MKGLVKIGIIVLSVCYPAAIFFGIKYWDLNALLIFVVLIGSFHLYSAVQGNKSSYLWVIACTIIIAWSWQQNSSIGLKFYPVIINAGSLGVFIWSLIFPPNIIERFARMQHGDLSDRKLNYTRKVAMVWCLFFVFNGSTAAYLAIYGSDSQWALYNGLIAYILMAVLFSCEWLVRQWHQQGEANNDA